MHNHRNVSYWNIIIIISARRNVVKATALVSAHHAHYVINKLIMQ